MCAMNHSREDASALTRLAPRSVLRQLLVALVLVQHFVLGDPWSRAVVAAGLLIGLVQLMVWLEAQRAPLARFATVGLGAVVGASVADGLGGGPPAVGAAAVGFAAVLVELDRWTQLERGRDADSRRAAAPTRAVGAEVTQRRRPSRRASRSTRVAGLPVDGVRAARAATGQLVRLRGPWRRLPLGERLASLLVAGALAFVTFVNGLVVLFARVPATAGHGTVAWTLSICGLLVSALVGLTVGAYLLQATGRPAKGRPNGVRHFAGTALYAVWLLLLVTVVAATAT